MTTPDSAPTPEILRARMVRRWMGLIEEAYQSRDDILTSAGYTPRSLGLNFVADQIRAEVERLAQSAPTDDAMWDQTLQERDTYHDWADKLAEGIAAHLGVDIGEHTAGAGANNPWANALEAIQAVAQSAPLQQAVTKEQRELIAKLRYMGKQYSAGQYARGCGQQKHYLDKLQSLRSLSSNEHL